MPIEPVVKLFDVNTNVEYDNVTNIIDFGEVKAGDASEHKILRLWNNKGGTEDASTMRDVEMFVLDGNDAKLEPIVKQGWLHFKCLSANETSFTRLYDTNTVKLTAKDQAEGEILGTANSGEDSDTANYAEFELYAQIIEDVLTATHGEKPFSLAVRYYFT